MNRKEFEGLLGNMENKDVDFKLDLPGPEKVATLVTAFYNSGGGKIILGVEDESRKPVGVSNPQEIEHRFTQFIRHYCSLDEDPGIEFVRYSGRDFLVIHCPKGRNTPYFVKGQTTPRVRVGSSNMPANREEIARLYRDGSGESQDIHPVKNSTLDDLDMGKIREYFRESYLTKQLKRDYLIELMLKEHFVVRENNLLIPTVAGLLLFGRNPYLNLHHSEVKADRYVGDLRVEWLDRQDIRGNLFDVLDQTEKFFLRNMRTPAKVVGFKTETRTEYPLEALREAVTNALVHRDWHKQETILIRMYNSFVEILSPGELLRPLTIEDLKRDDYVPKTRNNIIAGVFNDLEMMDKRGTGFLRIREALEKWKLPEPEFEERQGWFIIRFRNPYVEIIPEIDETILNDRQKKAIEYLRVKGKITTREYMKINKVSERTARNDLAGLYKKKVVERLGATTSLRYVLSPAISGNLRQSKGRGLKNA